MKHIRLLLICLMLSGASYAADYYVDVNATGANNGTSWADAWTSMNTAMTSTPAGNTINIAEGTYVAPADGWVPTNGNLTLVAKTGDDVVLSGDVNGDDVDVDLMDDPCALKTAFESGDRQDNTRILSLSSKNMTLTGLTFKGGATSGHGGSINMDGTTALTLNDCVITQSYTAGRGGAIYHNASGALTLNRCRITQTSCWNAGSVIRTNSSGAVTLTGCLLQKTVAIDHAGALYINYYTPSVVISDCIFDRTQMCNNAGGCSGINTRFRVDSNVTITNCVFRECMSYHHGAAAYIRADVAEDTDVTCTMSNCLVTGCTNWAPDGDIVAVHAELYEPYSSVEMDVTNCTIVNNHANAQGHVGAFCATSDTTTHIDLNLKNCIVWGNTGGADNTSNAQLFVDTSQSGYTRITFNADYSCWDNTDPNDWGHSTSLGTGNLLKTADATLDPGFEPGLLREYALSSASPCIDTGDPTSDYSAEPKCNGDRINMGTYGGTAYATPTASTTKLADLDCDNDVDLADFSVMSGQWLQ